MLPATAQQRTDLYTPGIMTPSEGLHPSVRALIRRPLWRRWAAASGLSRLPVAMVPLAFVLAGQYATGSFAAGALLVSVHALSEAVAAPWGGRLLDRREVRGGVQQALVVAAGALALLAGAVSLRAPLPLLLLLAAAVGAIPAGVPGGYRALLPHIVPRAALDTAYALDASLLEVEWMIAPVLVAVAVLLHTPIAAVLLMASAAILAAAATGALPRLAAQATGVARRALWRDRRAVPVYALMAALSVGIGAMEAGLPALLVSLGAPAATAGLLLGLLAVASATGGLVYGSRVDRWPGTPARRAPLLLALLGVLLLPLGVVPTAPLAAPVLILAGLLLAPLVGLCTSLLQQVLPPTQRAEGFSLLYAASGLGYGGGSLLIALLLRPLGPHGTLLVTALVPLVVGSVMFITRATRP